MLSGFSNGQAFPLFSSKNRQPKLVRQLNVMKCRKDGMNSTCLRLRIGTRYASNIWHGLLEVDEKLKIMLITVTLKVK